MKLWSQRKTQADAYEWKREKEGQIRACIQIAEAVLRSHRTELAELQLLEGERLAARFCSEKEAFKERTEWIEDLAETWIEAPYKND